MALTVIRLDPGLSNGRKTFVFVVHASRLNLVSGHTGGVSRSDQIPSHLDPSAFRQRGSPGSFIHCFQEWKNVSEQLTDVPRGHRELRVVNQLVHGSYRQQALRSCQFGHCSV